MSQTNRQISKTHHTTPYEPEAQHSQAIGLTFSHSLGSHSLGSHSLGSHSPGLTQPGRKAGTGATQGSAVLVANQPSREAGRDRNEGGLSRSVRHVPACRSGSSTATVRGHRAADRRPVAEASTDMTPCIIAAIGWNRRAPDSRRLPNDRFLAPNAPGTRARIRRVAHLKTPNRVVGSRFRSKQMRATVFGS